MPPRKVLLKSSEDFLRLQAYFQRIILTKIVLNRGHILFFLCEFLFLIRVLPTRKKGLPNVNAGSGKVKLVITFKIWPAPF